MIFNNSLVVGLVLMLTTLILLSLMAIGTMILFTVDDVICQHASDQFNEIIIFSGASGILFAMIAIIAFGYILTWSGPMRYTIVSIILMILSLIPFAMLTAIGTEEQACVGNKKGNIDLTKYYILFWIVALFISMVVTTKFAMENKSKADDAFSASPVQSPKRNSFSPRNTPTVVYI